MALKRNQHGQFIISSKAEAVRALTMLQTLQDEITEIQKEHGIDEMMVDCVELKKAATAYCVDNGIEELKVPKVGKVARLIRAVHTKRWIASKDEITPDMPAGTKPLRSLVDKETWMKITKRVPDPEAIDQAVADGLISAKKIAPAYVETTKAPYLGIYDDGS